MDALPLHDAYNRITSKDGNYYYYATAGGTRPHAPISDGLNAFTYDANGNMTSDKGRSIVYDAENRVTSITKDGNPTTFAYDDFGQRLVKTVGSGTTVYWSADYEERYVSGTLSESTKFYRANGQKIAQRSSASGLMYIHQDHLGSTTKLTDASGAVTQSMGYTPYGSDAYSLGGDYTDYQFTGQEKDASTGLYYYGARYYDPDLGLFIQADTVLDGMNRYAYCGNNPVMYTDPTGFMMSYGGMPSDIADSLPDTPATPATPSGGSGGGSDGGSGEGGTGGGYYVTEQTSDRTWVTTYYGPESSPKSNDKSTSQTTGDPAQVSGVAESPDLPDVSGGFSEVSYGGGGESTPLKRTKLVLGDFGFDRSRSAYEAFKKGEIVSGLGYEGLYLVEAFTDAGAAFLIATGVGAVPKIISIALASYETARNEVDVLQTVVDESIAKGPTRNQLLTLFKGKLRIEKGVESIPKAIQKELGVKIPGAIQKPWHMVVNGREIPLNPFNRLWEFFK